MASRRLDDLTQRTQDVARACRAACETRGFDLLIYCTFRSAEEQAKLYRQSRTTAEIAAKIAEFRAAGFPHLGRILDRVGPVAGEIGRHVTMAGPGESWHQYREAFDAVPVIGGKLAWNPKADERTSKAWAIYGGAGMRAGGTWAGTWKNFKEFPHMQWREAPNPLKCFEREDIVLRAIGELGV